MPAPARPRPARAVPTVAETRRVVALVAVVTTAAIVAVLIASRSDAWPVPPHSFGPSASVPGPRGGEAQDGPLTVVGRR